MYIHLQIYVHVDGSFSWFSLAIRTVSNSQYVSGIQQVALDTCMPISSEYDKYYTHHPCPLTLIYADSCENMIIFSTATDLHVHKYLHLHPNKETINIHFGSVSHVLQVHE